MSLDRSFRVLFMGSPEFALPSLLALLENPELEVVGVVSQPDRPSGRKMQLQPTAVKSLALARGLPVWTPETVNTIEFRQQIKTLNADVGVVVAFGQILGQKFLDLFPFGCVNIHGSLLPRWRGAAPIQRALMAGDLESGVSLQRVVKKLDAGDVIGERRLTIPEEWDAISLHDALSYQGAELLREDLKPYLRSHRELMIQDESKVTHAAKIDKAEADILWTLPAREIFNKIRGLALGPQASTLWRGKRLKILKTRAHTGQVGAPGQVIEVSKESFRVACGEGALEIFEVQPESKSRMTVSEFIRGYSFTTQDKLGPEH